MTNAQIIFNESTRLMNEGILKPTGRVFKTEDGQEFPEVEPIHTYQAWKSLGYQVKKGEKAIAKFPIWKYTKKTVKNENNEDEDKASMFMKLSAFFTAEQVEKIEEN